MLREAIVGWYLITCLNNLYFLELIQESQMGQVLSEGEVDALLKGVGEGEVQTEMDLSLIHI